jgi:hypothetical protein
LHESTKADGHILEEAVGAEVAGGTEAAVNASSRRSIESTMLWGRSAFGLLALPAPGSTLAVAALAQRMAVPSACGREEKEKG